MENSIQYYKYQNPINNNRSGVSFSAKKEKPSVNSNNTNNSSNKKFIYAMSGTLVAGGIGAIALSRGLRKNNETILNKIKSTLETKLENSPVKSEFYEYSIRKNTDFIYCLTHSYFLKNNITADDKTYDNENKDFLNYYNS